MMPSCLHSIKPVFAALVLLSGFTQVCFSQVTQLVPTFESCGVYIPAQRGSECRIYYKAVRDKEWKEAYPPVYDTLLGEFRGSIVRLKEDTRYMVKAQMVFSGNTSTLQDTFTTWSSGVPVKEIIPVSSLYDKKGRLLKLSRLKGSADGWIKIVGDIPVEGDDNNESAVLIEHCSYVLIDGLTVTGGYRHGILIKETCSDVRISNCDISKWGRTPGRQNINGHYLDRDGKEINNDGGITLQKAKNIVVERCYIHDPNGYTNPWTGVVDMGEHRGQIYKWSHPQGPNGIYVMQSAGGFVMRYNDIIGGQLHRYNDPVEDWRNGDIDGGFNRDADIYGNMMAFGQDDGIELDGGQCNVRMYDNRIEQVFCGISTAPNKRGPSYVFDNLVWNLGNSNGVSSVGVKNGGGTEHSKGVTFVFNNTMVIKSNVMTGVGYGKSTPEHKREMFHAVTRNNIFYSLDTYNAKTGGKGKGLSISDMHLTATNDYDYDMIANAGLEGGAGKIMAVEGSERNGVFAAPVFTDMDHGVFTLRDDDPGRGRGVRLPNFHDTYPEGGIDMGAIPYGSSGLMPRRPVNIESDMYYVKLESGVPRIITLTVGDIQPTRFSLRKCEDMDWLHADCPTDKITRNSTLTISLVAGEAEHRRNGILLVRLQNGFSIPITVCAD